MGSVIDCRRSAGCRNEGACTAVQGRCVAGSNADCQQAWVCRQWSRCVAVAYQCRTTMALQEPADDSEADGMPTGFSVKAATGIGYAVLQEHPIVALAGQFAVGVQIRNLVAIHGECDLWKGETDQALSFFTASVGMGAELALWRVRPGLGLHLHWLRVGRATPAETMRGMGYTGRLRLDLDILQSDHANLFVGAKGAAGVADHGMVLVGAALNLGGRFKHP